MSYSQNGERDVNTQREKSGEKRGDGLTHRLSDGSVHTVPEWLSSHELEWWSREPQNNGGETMEQYWQRRDAELLADIEGFEAWLDSFDLVVIVEVL